MHAAVVDHLGFLPTGLGSTRSDRLILRTPWRRPAVEIVEFIR